MKKALKSALPWWLVLIATVGVFATGLRGKMLFDDHRNIIANSDIEHFPDVIIGSTRPLSELTFYLNYAISGSRVELYHAVNILIHCMAALLLYGIVRRTLGLPRYAERYGRAAPWIAAAAALLWSLHPLQTESVTYIVQRSESMAGMFVLLTLYAFLRGSTTPSRRTAWMAVSIVTSLLAMLSKPVALVAPLLVLLYDLAVLKPLSSAPGRRKWHLALWLTCLIPVALLMIPNESSTSVGVGGARPGPWIYLLTQCEVIVHYLRLVVWPDPLCIDYAWPPVAGLGDVWCPAATLLILAAVSMVMLRRGYATALLPFWFLVALAPTSSIIPVDDLAAERRMYLALAAPAVGAALGIWEAVRWIGSRLRLPPLRRLLVAALPAGAVLVALGTVTIRRNADYSSEAGMWRNVLEQRPRNLRARMALGTLALGAGNEAEAEACFAEVLAQLPDRFPDAPSAQSTLYSLTQTNMGVLRERQGRFDEAVSCFRAAISVSKLNADARVNLGIVLSRAHENPESKRLWEAAVAIEPNHAKGNFCLGWLALKQGNAREAETRLTTVAGSAGELAERARGLLEMMREAR